MLTVTTHGTTAWSQKLIRALSTGDYMKNVKMHPVKTRCSGLSVHLDKWKQLQFYLVGEPDQRKKFFVLEGSKIFHLSCLSNCW